MKLHKSPTFADTICDLRARKIKTTFFTQINTLVDWNKLEKLIDKDYSKGVEDRLNDSISFSYFFGMNIDEVAPDHSTFSCFVGRKKQQTIEVIT